MVVLGLLTGLASLQCTRDRGQGAFAGTDPVDTSLAAQNCRAFFLDPSPTRMYDQDRQTEGKRKCNESDASACPRVLLFDSNLVGNPGYDPNDD